MREIPCFHSLKKACNVHFTQLARTSESSKASSADFWRSGDKRSASGFKGFYESIMTLRFTQLAHDNEVMTHFNDI